MFVLDLGCGVNKVAGSIGIDRIPLLGVDLVFDLDSFPYPLIDNIVDKIYLNDVIEHLPDTIAAMEEFYRLCSPNARLKIRVVNWNSHYAFEDPTHKKIFTEHSFDFYGKYKLRSYYSTARFDVISCEYQFNEKVEKKLKSKRLLKFLSNYLNNILEGLHFELAANKPLNDQPTISESKPQDLFEIIRCPACLNNNSKPPPLTIINQNWLVCQDSTCQAKYPIINGAPILLKKIGLQWSKTTATNLPTPILDDNDYSIKYLLKN